MKKSLLLFTFIWVLSATMLAQRPIDGLAHRILGNRDTSFVFRIQDTDRSDYFRIEQQGVHIAITGNNNNSLAMGLNHYLKHHAHVHISWFEHEAIDLPNHFPPVAVPEQHEAVVRDRFFLNYCTYGYTMPWWQWRQWEHFIDWMALNGITMPLAITGQESVWYDVWKEYGMTDDEIRSYFSGPAHLPWHRMANLDSFGGPLPMQWLDDQKELQRRIVARERELDMTPVLPAFAGHVPKRFADMHPGADIQRLSAWCGFEPTYFLNATDPLFAQIQQKFMRRMTELFGTDHIYGVDPFNEMDPPSWDPDYLAGVSQNIYRSLTQVDPQARWLQMSWVFYYKRKSWTPERLRAYLTAVPNNGMVLLDYFCEKTEVWRTTDGFYGQPYIWCYLGNFGGNTMLVGNLRELEDKLAATLHDADHNLAGIGSTLESFDVSPHIYEYLFERAWTHEPDLPAWTQNWARTRTGRVGLEGTWKLLVDSIYRDWSFYGLGTQLVARPTLEGHGTYYTKPYYSYSNDSLWSVCSQLIRAYRTAPCLNEFQGMHKESYDYDLINFLSQWLGNHFMDIRNDFTRAYHQRDIAGMEHHQVRANELFQFADQLLNTHPSFMIGPWIAHARALGRTDDEKDYYEEQARTLLTTWGGPILNDYANRMWGGLVSDYYAKRWNMFFNAVIDSVKAGRVFDEKGFDPALSRFENEWVHQHGTYATTPVGTTWEVAQRIFKKYNTRPINPLPTQSIQTGDLLFVGTSHKANSNGMDEAILQSTGHNADTNYTHVAILELDSTGQLWVIDATPKRGVDRHPLDTFLLDFELEDGNMPIFKIMRLRNTRDVHYYMQRAKSFIGQPYDFYYLSGNEAQYCSELVQNAYRRPIDNKFLFKSIPMNFKSADGSYPTFWVELFQSIGQTIPQGKPGTNPNHLQKSKILTPIP